MTDRNVEQALRTALEHAAPNDVESVLLRCDDRKGNVIPMTNQNPEKKNRKPLRWPLWPLPPAWFWPLAEAPFTTISPRPPRPLFRWM